MRPNHPLQPTVNQYNHPLDYSRGNPGPSFAFVLAVSIGTAVAVAAIMTLFSYFGGAAALMAVSGAREIQKSDDPQLFNVVEEMAIAGGLPMPRIFVIDDPAPNAFATGRDPRHAVVAITTGLRNKLSRDELQGVMARLYAQADGLEAETCQALEEHYWPITLSGTLPSSETAAMVALADKLDTLAGDFSVGLIPSGSADPYGLRRAAVGILRILEARKWPLDLGWLLGQALEVQPSQVKGAAAETKQKLAQFMEQRFAALLEDRGFKPDEISAVFSAGVGAVPEALARLDALHGLRARPEFEPLSIAFKRGMNIVRQAVKGGELASPDGETIRAELFREPCEQALSQALESAGAEVSRHLEGRSYRQALEAMVHLREPLDGFFLGVMVMADDPALRANRLALIKRLVNLFARIADFSKLQNA